MPFRDRVRDQRVTSMTHDQIRSDRFVTKSVTRFATNNGPWNCTVKLYSGTHTAYSGAQHALSGAVALSKEHCCALARSSAATA